MRPTPHWLPPALRESLDRIRPAWSKLVIPEGTVAVILGSGLGEAAKDFPIIWECGFRELGLLSAGVEGHKGSLILAESKGGPLLFLSGRLHRYEGHPDEAVLLPHAALALLNLRALLITNAAGGLDPSFNAGDFMLIRDILSSQWRDPLRGETGIAPASLRLFDESLFPGLRRAAGEGRVVLREGVLHAGLGPAFETPAEVAMARKMGASSASMSTFPESVLYARMGMPTAAISCITNVIRDDAGEKLTHEEVLETGLAAASGFGRMLAAWTKILGE
jgi:purine-nucleoside phosphorylase